MTLDDAPKMLRVIMKNYRKKYVSGYLDSGKGTNRNDDTIVKYRIGEGWQNEMCGRSRPEIAAKICAVVRVQILKPYLHICARASPCYLHGHSYASVSVRMMSFHIRTNIHMFIHIT